jgi:pimeloyl-ACP methyl ester carboxylesterase
MLIDRAFLRLDEGLVHYRSAGLHQAGAALPLYLAHGGPGSSLGMVPLMESLGSGRLLIAPDMLGNGDSAPPAYPQTTIGYYSDCVVRILDRLHIERVDFYGYHTGAQIACDLAVARPDRINRMILDGLPLFSDALKKRLLAEYAPVVLPDDDGAHLLWVWHFYRNQFRYFPHFMEQPENRLNNPMPPAASLHAGVVDVLKALSTYRIAYQAAFSQDVHGLLPKITAPVLLIAAERDPLNVYADEAASLLPHAITQRLARTEGAPEKAAAIRAFIEA